MDLVEIVYRLTLILVGAALLNLIAKQLIDQTKLPRLSWWTAILLPFAITHVLLIDFPVFARMVALCVVLLLGMKIIIYAEWKRDGGKKMPWLRWCAFSFLWFGMDPKAWVGERRTLSWGIHARTGFMCLCLGSVLMCALVWMDCKNTVCLFIAMSMLFHFGVLRLLTAFWKWMGYPVRVLFRNPISTCGFVDFWSKRWNLAYSFMMARAVQRPLKGVLGDRGSVFAVFFVSGVFHEFAITVPAQAGYGLPTLFFVTHGLFTVFERKDRWWNRWLCFTLLIVGIPVLFPLRFQEEVFYVVVEQWKVLVG